MRAQWAIRCRLMAQQQKDFGELWGGFKGLSPLSRLFVSVLIAVGLGLIAAAERDLGRRPAASVRGSKLIWRLVCTNALGAAVYLRWGRRERR
jgi:hypothetical protein